MRTPSEESLAAAAAEAEPLRRLQAFTRWVGAGRKLTQTGRITLADARELVGLLGTGDVIDPKIGDRVFRTTSSEELRGITTVAEWAKASGLARVTSGRLVGVKKYAGLLERPLELWARMFEAFPRLGVALCVSGWGESLLRDDFEEGMGAVLAAMARQGGAVGLAEACALAWETVAAGYVLDDLTDQQLATLRQLNDRDVRHALEVLGQLGAVRFGDGESVGLTELARWALGRRLGAPTPGDPVLQVRITLAEVADPAVWRRLLVPAAIRLDRLHQVIQASRGCAIRCVWPARAPARPRTAAARGGTPTSARSLPTPPARSTTTCWRGWGWTTEPTSTPTGSTWNRPTGPSASSAPHADDPRTHGDITRRHHLRHKPDDLPPEDCGGWGRLRLVFGPR